METITDKMERLRLKAELFLSEDTPVFIKTYSNDWFWGDIIIVGEKKITIDNIRGKRKGIRDSLLFLDIDELEKDEGEIE